MTSETTRGSVDRRRLLKLGGVATGALAMGLLSGSAREATGRQAAPMVMQELLPNARNIHLAATDGWIYVPGTTRYLPDPMAPSPYNVWGFGFRDLSALYARTDLTAAQKQQLVSAQRGRFQNPAPILWADAGEDVVIHLHNLGLSVRPDLTDSHTIHWHGFRNAIPLFDGVPEVSIAVPIGREFGYYYRPEHPGTYMYHCHFEDVEHVSMGMTGVIFVRPAQNAGTGTIPAGKYAYEDGVLPSDPRSTAYDREWVMFLTELWTQERYEGAHIQEHDWSDYKADTWLLNGRCYPDTLAPNGSQDDAGVLSAPPGHPELERQPISSYVEANAGDRVLLRFVNLGFEQQAMNLQGPEMHVVGLDATPLVGRDGTDNSFWTDTIYIGPGESADAIFVCPPVTSDTTFLLANRNLGHLHNPGGSGLGGQLTQVVVRPAGTLPPTQSQPNH
jgi:FtsP/CotA-like multicopper oxidase with cupredoxin domain